MYFTMWMLGALFVHVVKSLGICYSCWSDSTCRALAEGWFGSLPQDWGHGKPGITILAKKKPKKRNLAMYKVGLDQLCYYLNRKSS